MYYSYREVIGGGQKLGNVKTNFNSYYFESKPPNGSRLQRQYSHEHRASEQRRRKGISLSLGRSKTFEQFYPDNTFGGGYFTNSASPKPSEPKNQHPSKYTTKNKNQEQNRTPIGKYALTDPYELSSMQLTATAESFKPGGDSRITTQLPSKVPSRTNSFVGDQEPLAPLARSLNMKQRQSESQIEYQMPRHRPIFNKKIKESALRTSTVSHTADQKITLKDAPLYYSIVVDDGKLI